MHCIIISSRYTFFLTGERVTDGEETCDSVRSAPLFPNLPPPLPLSLAQRRPLPDGNVYGTPASATPFSWRTCAALEPSLCVLGISAVCGRSKESQKARQQSKKEAIHTPERYTDRSKFHLFQGWRADTSQNASSTHQDDDRVTLPPSRLTPEQDHMLSLAGSPMLTRGLPSKKLGGPLEAPIIGEHPFSSVCAGGYGMKSSHPHTRLCACVSLGWCSALSPAFFCLRTLCALPSAAACCLLSFSLFLLAQGGSRGGGYPRILFAVPLCAEPLLEEICLFVCESIISPSRAAGVHGRSFLASRAADMLNALLVFCAVVLLFVYLLVKNYDDDTVISSTAVKEGAPSSGKAKDWSKRRKRNKGNKAAGAGCGPCVIGPLGSTCSGG